MTTIIELYFKAIRLAIVLLLAAMVCLVFGNVVLRYVFNQGITVSEELSRIFFVWLTFLGSVLALREHAHLGVDTLVRRLPLPVARITLFIAQLLMLAITWLILSGSWTQTLINIPTTAPATGMSMGWFYGAGLAFAVPAMLIIAWDALGLLNGRIDLSAAQFVGSTEEIIATQNSIQKNS